MFRSQLSGFASGLLALLLVGATVTSPATAPAQEPPGRAKAPEKRGREVVDKANLEAAQPKVAVARAKVAAAARAKCEQAAAHAVAAARALRRANTPAEKAQAEAKLDHALVLVDAAEADVARAEADVARAWAEEAAENLRRDAPKAPAKDDKSPDSDALKRAELKQAESALEAAAAQVEAAKAHLEQAQSIYRLHKQAIEKLREKARGGKTDDSKRGAVWLSAYGKRLLTSSEEEDMPKVVSGQMILHGILESVDAKKSVVTVKTVVGNDASSVMRLMALVPDKKPADGGLADALLKQIGPDNYPKLVNVPVRATADGVIGIGVGMAKPKLKMEDMKAGQVVMLQLAADRTNGFVVVFVRVLSDEKKKAQGLPRATQEAADKAGLEEARRATAIARAKSAQTVVQLEAAARALVKAATPAEVKQAHVNVELALALLDAARADVARAEALERLVREAVDKANQRRARAAVDRAYLEAARQAVATGRAKRAEAIAQLEAAARALTRAATPVEKTIAQANVEPTLAQLDAARADLAQAEALERLARDGVDKAKP
jgi:multidrug efflux pump subunit AcrA (membrane-fusion protein)